MNEPKIAKTVFESTKIIHTINMQKLQIAIMRHSVAEAIGGQPPYLKVETHDSSLCTYKPVALVSSTKQYHC